MASRVKRGQVPAVTRLMGHHSHQSGRHIDLYTSDVYDSCMSDQRLGNQIKSERDKQGWDQAALARAMGVTQQTVSRWESGQSRPRRDDVLKLADLFKASPNEWLAEAGYQMEKPVRPLVPFLPLDKLTAENFELFSRDFVQALNPRADVHRYGSQGHTQEGIDLYSKEGDRILDYQCKRHLQFGPADVKKAVDVTTFVAEHHHLLLTRTASPSARQAIIKYTDWSLWDLEDVSAKVRSLPKDDALRIVDTYFPSWRKDFLGVEELGPWQSPEQFFWRLTRRTTIFSHAWTLVGRRDEVEALSAFALHASEQAIVLSGRGGVGKSRLLRAFSEALPQGHKVVFAAQGADITPRDIELLPGEGVLVLDDVHEYTDSRALLNFLAITRPALKIVLSTRPYGVTKIRDELTSTGIDTVDNTICLDDLSLDDARALSEEIISAVDGDLQYAPRLAEITRDCPLATVVGSRMVAAGGIRPELLSNSEQFREHLLRSFRDIIIGEIGGSKDAASIRELLDFVALIQPIDPADPGFEAAATAFLDRRYDKVLRDLRALEDAGVLLRRRNRLRIVPDLLADYIRENASYDEKSRRPTGYADEVFKVVSGDLATNLLANLSQLDWRISGTGAQSAILERVWSAIETEFQNSKILGRMAILAALTKVAYYQPGRTLAIAKLTLSLPTDEVEDTGSPLLFRQPSYADVLHKLPPILKYVAYDPEHVIQALNMLKELAKLDKRPPNQTPEHPMRVLTELASITPGKPVGYIEMVVSHVLSWLPGETGDEFSPFDVVEATLATEGQEPELHGITLTLKRYKVMAAAVAGIRKLITDKAFETILTRPTPEAVRAVKVIGEALHGPRGTDVTAADTAAWEPGFLEILHRLTDIVADLKLDPYVSVEIRDVVQWHASFSKTATGPAAKAVLNAIPITTAYELSRALADSWGRTFDRAPDTVQRDEAAFNQWRQELARKLVIEHTHDYGELIRILEERITTLARLKGGGYYDAGPLIGALVEQSSAFGDTLGEHILGNPGSPLATMLGVVIVALAKDHYTTAITFAERGIQQANLDLLRRISRALGWGLRDIPIGPQEAKLIVQLGQSDDVWTKQQIVHVVTRFPPEQKSLAIRFLLSIDFGTSKELADEVLGEFGEHGPFSVVDLDPDQITQILARLVKLVSIDDYNIGNFLRELSVTEPNRVLQLLLDRVERQEAHEGSTGYTPLPHSWDHQPPFRFRETAAYERILRRVRDWTNGNTESWHRRHYGPEIFKLVSTGFDEATLQVLDEWIMAPNQQQLETAAALLEEAGRSFVWQHPEFVASVLDRAQQFGDSCYQHVSASLHTAAIQGVHTRTPGQPSSDDIEVRDRAQQLMSALTPGSPAYRFYKALHGHATANIQRDTIDDDDLFEE